MSDVELRGFLGTPGSAEDDLQFEASQALIDLGVVDTYADGERIANGLSADVRRAHSPGHALFHFGTSGAPDATFIGHLAVSRLHLTTGECPVLQSEPGAAWSLLCGTVQDGRILIGPLWPTLRFGRWRDGALVARDWDASSDSSNPYTRT